MQQEGIESLEHAHAMNMELANTSAAVENKAMLLDQQERELSEVHACILLTFLDRVV